MSVMQAMAMEQVRQKTQLTIDSHGFKRKVAAAMLRDSPDDPAFVRRTFREFSRVPDGFAIDEANRTVFMYEIEDSHRITEDKLDDLAWLWWDMDCECWNLRLVCYDRYGGTGTEVSLMDAWYWFNYRKWANEQV